MDFRQASMNLIKFNSNSSAESESISDSRFECPICYNWLNEPVLTRCGHRFCKSCIETWIKNKKNCCPLDNEVLTIENDIFVDNFTKREISQIKNPCPNYSKGCTINESPLQLDKHLQECQFRDTSSVLKCPFNCSFITQSEAELNTHKQNETSTHLDLILSALSRSNMLKSVDTKLWDAPSKTAQNHNHTIRVADNLIEEMFKRIVSLEQESFKQNCMIEELKKNVNDLRKICQDKPKFCNGALIWELNDFTDKLNKMAANPNFIIYSPEAYTSPQGYKFCARMNISAKTKEFISLHVHLMESVNDFHLDWPFKGVFKITMVHPANHEQSQSDKIMSKPDVQAFNRPRAPVCPRGFGFVEYALICDIQRRGFVKNDRLIIKVEMNSV